MKQVRNSKVLLTVVLCVLFFSCNQSMQTMVDDYNGRFIPSSEIFWTEENIKKSTQDFENYKMENEYTMSESTGLFIIGGPRDCDTYTWFLNGIIISGNQVLELKINKEKTDLSSGNWVNNGSMTAGEYTLILKATSKGGVEKEWKTRLKIE